MDDYIRTFAPGSGEYDRLSAAAAFLSAFSRYACAVTDVYYDLGQGWKWTTIEACRPGGTPSAGRVQLLCPRDHAAICGGTPDDFMRVCKERLAYLESR